MIIEEKVKTTTFEDLNNGDVFRYGSIYYLKVPPCKSAGTGYEYNSYDLYNDDYCCFADDREVYPVKAKLVIE